MIIVFPVEKFYYILFRIVAYLFHLFFSIVLNKKNELTELQKALSDSHLAVYDERMQFMKLKREYELLNSTI